MTLRARIAPLRSQFVFPTVRLALLAATRRAPARFRIVHFSVQRDHVHLIVEAADKSSLSSGVRGAMIRVARYVNDLLARRGPFWADRWHGRALTTPCEVRRAIVYVLANFRKHASRRLPPGVDPYSSGVWFDGFKKQRCETGVPPPCRNERIGAAVSSGDAQDFAARTWLARYGWKRYGLVGMAEGPRA